MCDLTSAAMSNSELASAIESTAQMARYHPKKSPCGKLITAQFAYLLSVQRARAGLAILDPRPSIGD